MFLEFRSLNYKWTKIAELMEISRSTLYRRLEEEGISPDDHTHLLDAELDDVIRSLKQDHPNDDEVLMQGHLIRMRIRVTRQALRNSIHRGIISMSFRGVERLSDDVYILFHSLTLSGTLMATIKLYIGGLSFMVLLMAFHVL